MPLLPLRRRRASSFVEYGILVALVAVGAIGAVALLGQRTSDLTDRTGQILAGDAAAPGQAAGEPLQGVLPGALAWSPPLLSFALSPTQPTATGTATLTNIGGGRSLPFSPPAVSGPGAVVFSITASDCPETLGAGESCALTIEASALSNGLRSAALGASGAPGGVPLQAQATGFDPLLTWSVPSPFAIDGAPGPAPLPRTDTQTLTLSNQGFADAPGVSPAILSAAGGTVSLSHDCPPVLAPGQACSVSATATAAADGALSALLAAGGLASVDVALSGQASGFAPLFAWSGGGALDLAAPSATPATVQRTFTLTNAGTLAAAPPAPSVSGDGLGYALSLAGTTCGAVLAPGQACTATVLASYSGNVTATGLLSAGATEIPLAGAASGFAPAWTLDGSGAFSITAPTSNPATQTLSIALRNTGTLAGTAPGPVLSGPHAGDFTVSTDGCTGQTVAVGETCSLSITFSATDTIAGRTATLSIAGQTLSLSGSASGFAPAFAWSGPATFVVTAPSSNPALVDRVLTLTNVGSGAGVPAVPTASGSGPGFAFSLASHTCGVSLAPGQACTATVRASYTTAVASATGVLTGGGASQALSGSASGFAASLTLAVESATIQTQTVTSGGGDNASDTTVGSIVGTLRLRNLGTASATITSYSVLGPASWSRNTCPAPGGTLAPGAFCDLSFQSSGESGYRCGQGLSFLLSATVGAAAPTTAASFSGTVSAAGATDCGGSGGEGIN